MKRCIAAFLLILTGALHGADTFASRRLTWWQLRESALRDEEKALAASAPLILPVIARQLERVRRIQAACTGGAPANLHAETPQSDEALEAGINSGIRSAFSRLLLGAILNGKLPSGWDTKAQGILLTRINAESDRILGSHSDFLSSNLIDRYHPREHRRWLLLEYYLTSLMNGRESLEAAFNARARSDIRTAAMERNAGKIAHDLIEESLRLTAGSFDIGARLEPAEEHFTDCWSAAHCITLSVRRFEVMKTGSRFVEEIKGNRSPEMLEHYATKPLELDKEYFAKKALMILPADATGEGTEALRRFIADCDKERSGRLAALGPHESTDELRSFRTTLQKQIDAFFPADVRNLAERRRAAENYADDAAEFITWVASVRASSSATLAALHTRKLERSRIYASFLADASRDAGDLRPHLTRIKAFYHSLGAASGIDRAARAGLKPSDLTAMTDASAAFRTWLNELSAESLRAPKTSPAHSAQKARAAADRDRSAEEALASLELAALAENTADLAKTHASLTYGDSAVRAFAETHEKLRRTADSGSADHALTAFIAARSILAQTPGWDAARLAAENRARDYLARSFQAEQARLKSLADYYRRMGHRHEPYAAQGLSASAGVPVLSWKASCANLIDIDKKASAALLQAINRKRWEAGSGTLAADTPVRLEAAGITVLIPSGWEPTGPGGSPGSLAEFRNESDGSRFEISMLESAEGMEADTLAKWAEVKRYRVSRTGTTAFPDVTALWGIYETPEKTVAKAYARRMGTRVIIVSGATLRQRYVRFAPRIEAIFRSARQTP